MPNPPRSDGERFRLGPGSSQLNHLQWPSRTALPSVDFTLMWTIGVAAVNKEKEKEEDNEKSGAYIGLQMTPL